MAVVFVLLLILPFVELAAFATVTGAIGFWYALGLIVVLAVAGLWLMKREGLGVWRRGTAKLQAGEMPTAEVVNGIILLMAGALLVFPGFVTDAVAVALLLPPVRSAVRVLLFRRFERRLEAAAGRPVGTAFTGYQTRISTGPATYGGPVEVREVTGPPPAGNSPPGRS
jgi:UPF0716 protein FxsA